MKSPLMAWVDVGVAQTLARQIVLIVLALVLASIVLDLMDYDPFAIVKGTYRSIATDFGDTIRWTTPLVLAGLAAAAAFRAGVWNLGIDGQLYFGAATAAIVGLVASDLPFPLSVVAAMLAGIIAGAIWALLAALLRVLWGANEVVTTLLLNFVAFEVTDYLVLEPFKGTGLMAGTMSTNRIPDSFWLERILHPSQANIGIFLAFALALVLAFVLFRTTIGYEFKLVRQNWRFARHGGVDVKQVVVSSMLISGAVAGLVGVVEILGVHHRFPARFSLGLGFDGIVVSLLAKNHPIGIIASGFFFGALRNGAMNMERLTDVPRSMVEVVQAIFVLLVSAQFAMGYVTNLRNWRWRRERRPRRAHSRGELR
ncbi:MAG: ABC transporter permease [Gammaproteobacteria bacterium]|nr:ABC transporter permease [Gammaproteobacteria bacterium]